MWFDIKQKYDVIKRKCREILKVFKKIRYYLYEIHFILKINVRILITQLNRWKIDLSKTFITRWIIWIRLFNFNVRHVSEVKHTVVNDLFKKSSSFENLKEAAEEENIDDWIEAQMNCVRLYSIVREELVLKSTYFEKSQKIATYLIILRKSSKMLVKKINTFKKNVLIFKI